MRREKEPLEKITTHLYRGDMDRIQTIAGRTGASKIIRSLVRAWLDQQEARFAAMPQPTVEIEL